MAYKGIKEVRKINGNQFLRDFERLRSFVAYTSMGKNFFTLKKSAVWEEARKSKVSYYLDDKIYTRVRTTMVLI